MAIRGGRPWRSELRRSPHAHRVTLFSLAHTLLYVACHLGLAVFRLLHHRIKWNMDQVDTVDGWFGRMGMEWHEHYFKGHVTKLRQDEMMDDRKLSSFSNRGLIVSVLAIDMRDTLIICLNVPMKYQYFSIVNLYCDAPCLLTHKALIVVSCQCSILIRFHTSKPHDCVVLMLRDLSAVSNDFPPQRSSITR